MATACGAASTRTARSTAISTYTVEDGRIWLTTSTDVTLACGWPPETPFFDASWTLEGDQLRMTDINSDPPAVREFSLPWTRVADDIDAANHPDGFPEGAYRVVTADGTVVTDVIMDGDWATYIDGRGRIDCSFTYEVESGRIMLTSSSCPGLPPNFMFLDATWTVDGDQLQFSDIHSDPNTVRDFGVPRTRIAVGEDPTAEEDMSTEVTNTALPASVSQSAEFPEGVYRMETTPDEMVAHGATQKLPTSSGLTR